ncbi:MAG: hypothetical protein A2Y03_10200 [Omnitrophica WOR_2 bacterium GWF2_38_59]|nr:MAG: hypothetical protein A2Y03_10200 [Omnitrophica WOR_2 bacterium GWF2_38_59]
MMISYSRGLAEQLMRSGFTVWFDPDGGKKKVLGIHFPAGMKGQGRRMLEETRGFQLWVRIFLSSRTLQVFVSKNERIVNCLI